jgi:riboflavin synthase
VPARDLHPSCRLGAEIPGSRGAWQLGQSEVERGPTVFTGLVETKGILKRRESRDIGARLRIGTHLGPLVMGESIAVQGVCLTVDGIHADGFECDASAETIQRSTLGDLALGSGLHLERAVPLGGRMGGHIVSGHVDGRVCLKDKSRLGDAIRLVFSLPRALARYVALKGSVAIDGVSLTVNGASQDEFDVVVVPHTSGATLLGDLSPRQEVNLEVDLLARYVARMLETAHLQSQDHPSPAGAEDGSLIAKLKAAGDF